MLVGGKSRGCGCVVRGVVNAYGLKIMLHLDCDGDTLKGYMCMTFGTPKSCRRNTAEPSETQMSSLPQ